jgi:acetyl/propionyl-CoA carboxylase alpha subunit
MFQRKRLYYEMRMRALIAAARALRGPVVKGLQTQFQFWYRSLEHARLCRLRLESGLARGLYDDSNTHVSIATIKKAEDALRQLCRDTQVCSGCV